MLVKPQIGFTYDCRRCEKPVSGTAELFTLQRRRYQHRCTCGESALVTYCHEGILHFEYPCAICGQRHKAEIPLQDALCHGPRALHCPVTDTAACYIGTPEQIQTLNSPESVGAIAAYLSRATGIPAAYFQEESQPAAADVLCLAGRLAEQDLIACHCGSLRFTAAYDDGKLVISCAACGAFQSFPADSVQKLQEIRKLGKITL